VGHSHRVGNSVDHGGSMVSRGSVNHGSGMVGRGSVGNSLGVSSGAVVGDLSNVAIVVVDMVVHMLDPAVGKSHGVRSLGLTGAVAGLSSVEVGVGVVVSNGVVVGVGRDLIRVNLSGMVSGSSVGNNRGVVGRDGMDHRGVVGRGSMGNNSVGQTMSDNTMGESMSNNSMGQTMSNNTVGESMSNNSV